VLQWFMSQIETFAPPAQREERQQLYADIGALPSSPSITLYDDVALFGVRANRGGTPAYRREGLWTAPRTF